MTIKQSRVWVLGLVALTSMAVNVGNAQQRGSDPEHRLPLTWDRWLDQLP